MTVHESFGDDPDTILYTIIDKHLPDQNNDEDLSEDENNSILFRPPSPPPSASAALNHITSLLSYAGAHDPSLIDQIFDIQRSIERNLAREHFVLSKQSSIDYYFKTH